MTIMLWAPGEGQDDLILPACHRKQSTFSFFLRPIQLLACLGCVDFHFSPAPIAAIVTQSRKRWESLLYRPLTSTQYCILHLK